MPFGAVRERTFELIETGEYVLTLNDLVEDNGGQYGDSLKWDWLVAPKDDPTGYLTRRDGMERTLRVWTGADIVLGGQVHEWVQALLGVTLKDGDEPPDFDDLLGKRMIAYLTHAAPKQGPNAGKMREKIVAGSAKKFGGLHKTVARNVASAPAEPAREPSMDPEADMQARAALIEDTKKQIRKAAVLDIEAAEQWAVIDLETMTTDQLRDGLRTIKDAIAAA